MGDSSLEFDPQNETFFDMNICISMSLSDTSSSRGLMACSLASNV